MSGLLTDLGYLVMAAFSGVRPLYRRWARWRYRRLAATYGVYVHDHAGYLDALTALLNRLAPSPRVIVEMGAGTGGATGAIGRRFPDAILVALDASIAMLGGLPTQKGVVHRLAGDAFALPLRPETADLVLAHNAPFDPGEMCRVAAPTGTIAVVLSTGGRIPRPVRRWLLGGFRGRDWACVEECRSGSGIAWAFQHAGPTAAAR